MGRLQNIRASKRRVGGFGFRGFSPLYPYIETELEFLRNQPRFLEDTLEKIEKRLADLETGGE